MLLLDLQGDQKGFSIGGLVVITKSMSLTVSYDFLPTSCPVSVFKKKKKKKKLETRQNERELQLWKH